MLYTISPNSWSYLKDRKIHLYHCLCALKNSIRRNFISTASATNLLLWILSHICHSFHSKPVLANVAVVIFLHLGPVQWGWNGNDVLAVKLCAHILGSYSSILNLQKNFMCLKSLQLTSLMTWMRNYMPITQVSTYQSNCTLAYIYRNLYILKGHMCN